MRWAVSTAHPRVSGENDSAVPILPVGVGSSPRERGKLAYVIIAVIVGGLIPA